MAYWVIALLGLALAAVFFVGWLVLLIIGIVKLVRKTGGLVLAIIGAVWGVGALVVAALGVVGYLAVFRPMRVADFSPAGYTGAMGAITLPDKQQARLVVLDRRRDKRLRLHVKDGVAQAPVGEYDLESCEIVARDKNGNEWIARCSPRGGSPSKLSVTAASPLALDVGSPFTASVSVASGLEGNTGLALNVTGRGGYSYTIRPETVVVGGEGGGVPRFEVVDKSGQVLWQGTFEYG